MQKERGRHTRLGQRLPEATRLPGAGDIQGRIESRPLDNAESIVLGLTVAAQVEAYRVLRYGPQVGETGQGGFVIVVVLVRRGGPGGKESRRDGPRREDASPCRR
jgi:hypothetical protein